MKMKKRVPLLLMFLVLTYLSNGQTIKFIKAADLDYWRTQNSDTVYIINFWASWCQPCLQELPDFEKITKTYANEKVKVILISNDFKKQVDTRLKPFVKKKGLKSTVLFMDESNPNVWIEKVNAEWGGSIPATLIIQKSSNFESFTEGKMSFAQLKNIIDPLIQLK